VRPFRLRAEQPGGPGERAVLTAGAGASRRPTRRAEILSRIALILGIGPDGDPALVDGQVIAATLDKETADPHSPVAAGTSTS
jgi:hypothetical protein